MGLFRILRNIWREKTDQATKALEDPIREGRYNIEDAKTEILTLRRQLFGLVKTNNNTKKQHKEHLTKVDTWAKLAEKAAKLGNRDDAETALSHMNNAKQSAGSLESQIKSNEATISSIKRDIAKAENQVARAESNHAQLSARMVAADTRKAIAESRDKFNSSSALSALNELEDAVQDAESGADAMEELAPDSSTLEDKYKDDPIQSQLDALMAKHGKK